MVICAWVWISRDVYCVIIGAAIDYARQLRRLSPTASTPVDGSPRAARDANCVLIGAAVDYARLLRRLTPPSSTTVDGSPRVARDAYCVIIVTAIDFVWLCLRCRTGAEIALRLTERR